METESVPMFEGTVDWCDLEDESDEEMAWRALDEGRPDDALDLFTELNREHWNHPPKYTADFYGEAAIIEDGLAAAQAQRARTGSPAKRGRAALAAWWHRSMSDQHRDVESELARFEGHRRLH